MSAMLVGRWVVQLTRSRISEQRERKFAGNFTPDFQREQAVPATEVLLAETP